MKPFAFLLSLILSPFLLSANERPNVIVILADDLGFSDLGCYGSEIETPNIDRLAKDGLRYTSFYNSARCCPSRASLMTGLHPHEAGIGNFTFDKPQEGLSKAFTGHLLPDTATLAEILGDAGYSTWMVGKWHLGIPGPIERGFQNYYGFRNFLAHSEDQWTPRLYARLPEGTEPEIKVADEDFYVTDVFSDYAVEFVHQAREKKDQPFFLYLAHSSPHFPIQAPRESIDKYVALYRKGWDELRRERFERLIRLGVIPADSPLPPLSEVPVDRQDIANGFSGERNPEWDSLSSEQKEDLVYRMATFAAMVEHVDKGVGRLIEDLREHGDLDNTLIFFTSDNGACYEWGPLGFDGRSRDGTTNLHRNEELQTIGQRGTHESYGSGWANLGNTPLNMYKHFCHEGGISCPLIAHWPGHIKRPGNWDTTPGHMMDLVPTICEATGALYPETRDGIAIQPVSGTSLLPTFDGESLGPRSLPFEHQGARGLRKGEWKIVWGKRQTDEVHWELFNLKNDRSEQVDLSSEHPEMVAQMAAEWDEWAKRVGAEPFHKLESESAEGTHPKVANAELRIEAVVESNHPEGVVLAHGGVEQGYAIRFDNGIPIFEVRVNGSISSLRAPEPVAGKAVLTATLSSDAMTLDAGGDNNASQASPGLLPVEPKDALTIGYDERSNVGAYEGDQNFKGRIISTKVTPDRTHAANTTGSASTTVADAEAGTDGRWSAKRANDWYDGILWPVGANFVPSSAINQLEMWQADTFDPEAIDRELGWASAIGMNTMRTFLHSLAWKQDPEGFFQRVDRYLEIADKHHIRTMFVIFDAVWNPYPQAGKQPEPFPGRHNSGWVQDPGRKILDDPAKQDELEAYVKAVISRYKDDPRVLVWDLFNEPDNANVGNFGGGSSQPDLDPPAKGRRATELLDKTFRWAREAGASQPLTAGVWGNPNWLEQPDELERLSLEQSDVISFHTYENPEETLKMILGLQKHGRPILCTEYMARGNNSTFRGILPLFNKYKIAAYNWGLVDGKSQTIYPWDSWKKEYTSEPEPWFHDVFRRDGKAYSEEEVRLIDQLTSLPPTLQSDAPETSEADSRETIEAGLKSHDHALFLKPGWIRDPYITLGPDDYYYLTGTTPDPGDPRYETDPYNLGLGDLSVVGSRVQVWRSMDLIAWESLGTPFTLEDSWHREPGDVIWAPEVHWIPEMNRWALVHCPAGKANLALSTGPELKGPWTHPMGKRLGNKHDPSLFKDGDTWWLLWGNTSVAPLGKNLARFTAPAKRIDPSTVRKDPATGQDITRIGHEGATMIKVGDRFVHFGTAWSTDEPRRGSYNLYYCSSKNIDGPYGPRQFAGRFLGHGTPFQDREGRWWCTAFFNGNIPPLSREGIEGRNLWATAQTINKQGVTIVPLDVRQLENGEIHIRAKDPAYATPGPDENQDFE